MTHVGFNGKGVNIMKFYVCEHFGRIMAEVKEGGPLVCCGEPMKELVPNTVEASAEKHLPVIEVEGDKVTVTVGSVLHPMEEEHYIEWIVLVTKHGNQRVVLKPGQEPKACFALCCGDEVLEAYAYCNLHGLWKTEA